MKTIYLFIAAFILFINVGSSQNYNPRVGDVSATEWEYDIFTTEFSSSCKRLESFLSKNKFTIVKQNETKFMHTYLFRIPKSGASTSDSILKTLGYISNKELKSFNNSNQLTDAKLHLEYLEIKKKEYEKMQIKIDSVKSSKYYEHWEKTRNIESEIYEVRKKIKQIENIDSTYLFNVDIKDEVTSPTYSRVNFIHMPGVEYSYLMVEQPKKNISHAVYQGLNLKYLFTKGKSFFELGAYKASKDSIKKDSIAFQELFMFEFGQDFYSRHFGRGGRKWLNLYIGYKTGMAVASNDLKIEWIPSVSPNIGVELFKNKFICIDSRANYFLPLINNRNLRGWAFSGAFNFVF